MAPESPSFEWQHGGRRHRRPVGARAGHLVFPLSQPLRYRSAPAPSPRRSSRAGHAHRPAAGGECYALQARPFQHARVRHRLPGVGSLSLAFAAPALGLHAGRAASAHSRAGFRVCPDPPFFRSVWLHPLLPVFRRACVCCRNPRGAEEAPPLCASVLLAQPERRHGGWDTA